MNFVHIAGHLGADPEVRFTSSGQKVTTLRVAARARKGSNEDNTIWWRVTVWGEQFDKMISFLKKGSAIMVVGEMSKPEIFNDKEGKPQISMSMTAVHIMFSPFGKTDKQNEQVAGGMASRVENRPASTEEYAGFASGQQPNRYDNNSYTLEDDIPF